MQDNTTHDHPSFKPPLVNRRRRKSSGPHLPRTHSTFDWIAIVLTSALAVFGPTLYGAVTPWAFMPLAAAGIIGILLMLLRSVILQIPSPLFVPPGVLPWVLFLLFSLVQLSYAPTAHDALSALVRASLGLLVYVAVFNLLLIRKRSQIFIGVLLFMASILCWYAIVQHTHESNMVLRVERPEQYGMRASATYICPNHFAHLLEMLIPLCVAMAFIPSRKKVSSIVGIYGLILLLPVVFLTMSRSAWLATGAGVGITSLLIAWKRDRRLFYMLLIALPLMALAAFAVLWLASPAFQERIQGAMIGSPDDAVEGRFIIWKDTIPMVKAAWFAGHGAGAFEWFYPHYQTSRMQFWIDYAHNEYLQFWAEFGLAGLTIAASILGSIFVAIGIAIRHLPYNRNLCLSAGLLGCLVASLVHAFFDFIFHIPANLHVQIVLVAAVFASLIQSEILRPRFLTGIPNIAARSGIGVLAVVLLFPIGKSFLADQATQKGEQAEKEFRYDDAAKHYARAASLETRNFVHHLKLADVLRTQSIFSLDPALREEKRAASLAAYQTAVARNPYDLDSNFGLCLSLFAAGQEAAAVETLLRVSDFAHHNLFFLKNAALQLDKINRPLEALKIAQSALALDPNDARLNKLVQKLAPPP